MRHAKTAKKPKPKADEIQTLTVQLAHSTPEGTTYHVYEAQARLIDVDAIILEFALAGAQGVRVFDAKETLVLGDLRDLRSVMLFYTAPTDAERPWTIGKMIRSGLIDKARQEEMKRILLEGWD
jgi:hypothetical protein